MAEYLMDNDPMVRTSYLELKTEIPGYEIARAVFEQYCVSCPLRNALDGCTGISFYNQSLQVSASLPYGGIECGIIQDKTNRIEVTQESFDKLQEFYT